MSLPYPTRVALLARRCTVPKKDGDRCTADKIPGEQFCPSHKQSVGRAVVRLLGGEG